VSLLREPLVHFLLAAAAIVAVDAWIVSPSERTIRVPAEAVERTLADREALLGRPLMEDERAELITGLADDEILRREAVERGLDRGGQVRSLLVQRMKSLLVVEPPEPTDEELRSWYDEHPDRFAVPARTDFDQVFFAEPSAVPPTLLAQLEGGADFWTLGDPLGPGASVRGASDRDLRGAYGGAFAETVREAPEGSWVGPIPSILGVHYVRLVRRTSEVAVPFEEADYRVREDWRRARTDDSIARALDEMRSRYRVVVEEAE